MKNGKTEHFWRIHKWLAERLLADLPLRMQDTIAIDPTGDTGVWFTNKVMGDATRIYEDANHKLNQPHTFRISKNQDIWPERAEAYA